MHSPEKKSGDPLSGLRMKTFSVFLGLILIIVYKPFAQITEDFSDGNITENPGWHGTTGTFIVNSSLQLQLNATAAGTAWLSTAFSAAQGENLEWEFFIKQSFAPSGANFGRVYLISDQEDLSAPLNGYYLQLGEAGSNDAVELFRQSGTGSTSVCRATAGAISSSFQIGIKVMRSADGVWQLLIDYSGGVDYVLEATGVDLVHTHSSFFGISCAYTITNATRFYYDNINICSSTPPDTIAPEILSLDVASSQALTLHFTEEVERASAEDPLHYFVSPASVHPEKATLKDDNKTLELSFAEPFQNGYEATLSAQKIKDLAGNLLVGTEKTFMFFVPSPLNVKDVIITEILADPSPRVQLPGSEFIEVFNRSENPIQLDGWLFSDGSSTGEFPAHILLPGAYATVCTPEALAEFSLAGPAIALSNFPTLNNAEDRLFLISPDEQIVDSVHYRSSWYKDTDKASGGWTLERVDTENFCAEESNWLASEDPAGGTPGKRNSVYASMPDNTGPQLVSVVSIAPNILVIGFNERLSRQVPAAEAFSIYPLLQVKTATFFDESLQRLALTLSQDIQPRQRYSLHIERVYDCPGNAIQKAFSDAVFVLPEEADPHDVVVNEILFNPRPTGGDFVEIYNRSAKTIDLRNWSVRNFNSAGGKNTTFVSEEPLLIGPEEYKVLTEDTGVLKGEYFTGRSETFWQTDLPGFNDDAGSVALVNADGVVIDSAQYAEGMHSPFLKDNEGVSLERISFLASGAGTENWHSASSLSGYATPGYVNSNQRIDLLLDDGSVVIEPEIIDPAAANRNFARIRYRFGQGGLMANVRIFDSEGRPIRRVAANELLGDEGFFRWDGDSDSGSRARTGYYLVWFEVFDSGGLVRVFRKRVVVY